jgi:hypothetical protein
MSSCFPLRGPPGSSVRRVRHRRGFLREVANVMTPGKVAVLAEIQETWETPVDTRLRPLGALVFRRWRAEVVEDQLAREAAVLRVERQRLHEELAQASAQTKAAMQAQIDAVDRQLEAIRKQAAARTERAKQELDAKVDQMRGQMKQANKQTGRRPRSRSV